MSRDPWQYLRQFTPARVGLGRSGGSLPTSDLLAFQLAHAQARDAVFSTLELVSLENGLATIWAGQGITAAGPTSCQLASLAQNRLTYLQRPDLGRRLAPASVQYLAELAIGPVNLAIVLADGLSANAANRQALPTLQHLLPLLGATGWTLAPVALVEQGRVAIGDEIGAMCQADIVLVLIGERPGLSSPDSLGAYLTWQPQPGLTDERRNCVSNIRPEGLGHAAAAAKLHYLLTEMRTKQLSGIQLKDLQTGYLTGPVLSVPSVAPTDGNLNAT